MKMIISYVCFICPNFRATALGLQSEGAPTIQYDLLNYFFAIVGILGLILGLYIIVSYRKKDKHNIFLGIFTMTTALVLLELVLYWLDGISYNPKVFFYKCLVFLWGPTLYLYFENKAFPTKCIDLKPSISKHYGIFLVSILLLLLIGNTNVVTEIPKYGILWAALEFVSNTWIKSAYCAFYFVLMIRQYLRDKKELNRMGRTWAKTLITFFTLVFLLVILRAKYAESNDWDNITKYLAAYLFATFIIIIGFLNIIFPQKPEEINDNNQLSDEKYKNSGLTEDMVKALKEQLIVAMQEDKLFLDHTVNLQSLADSLNTDRYSLSQVINQEFGKNFYEFINDYRIAESVKIIKQNPERIELVVDLIYESGFNNKVSFYKAFKKRKKMTPAKYIKEYSTTS
ncbi:helix-turn-helix domain-containing protein [Maribacter sp. ACAM166]|uniref:helix-turn-helix domain-containing protein n=1 Tax=Maribacter sp. ACAM166 TaxID=2508996 RepID=UPI0010FF3968|nr:helix-turn-helix domain-containing protein [Maribacter sp. ACAM166]TLP75642.1 AraC family transcriptional regulator [Maribacter sp. ACAM166]